MNADTHMVFVETQPCGVYTDWGGGLRRG
jgi:hypothetical protein